MNEAKERPWKPNGEVESEKKAGRSRLFCLGRRRTKVLLLSFAFLFVLMSAASAATERMLAAEEVSAPVSLGIYVLAADNPMAAAGLIGGNISFEKEDFLRALNLSDIDGITITQAPPVTDGELRVGNTVIGAGETVPASALSKLTYVPSGDITTSSFSFRSPTGGYDVECSLYMLEKINYPPTLAAASELSLNVSTYKNVKLFGSLPVFDGEGDEVTVQIVSYPASGLLELTDRHAGEYTFTPTAGFSGKDSFSYVAYDRYGNYSAAATVSLTVKKPAALIRFDDMKDSPAYSSAIAMAEEGIMDGTAIGASSFFYPEKTVTRGEFIVMTLHAIGMEELPSAATVFADDGAIPDHMKPYVAAAYDVGMLKGVLRDGELYAEVSREITVAEAAVMLGELIDTSAAVGSVTLSPTLSGSDIPAWAEASVLSLAEMGVLPVSSEFSASAPLTRGDSAVILNNLMTLCEK